jgi:hypothetical protein
VEKGLFFESWIIYIHKYIYNITTTTTINTTNIYIYIYKGIVGSKSGLIDRLIRYRRAWRAQKQPPAFFSDSMFKMRSTKTCSQFLTD